MIEKIILKKSAVLDKMPSPEQLEYGEIALNFNTMNPFISLKDTADGIRQIRDYSNEIQNINGSLTDAKNEINALRTDIDKNTEYISNVELQKVAKTDIVQSVGNATDKIMSQKASTDSFIANTPSGDPMHNMYVAVGAVWNAKTGFWELNGLTDITNEQMLTIYVETNNFLMYQSDLEACYCFSKCRTNIPNIPYLSSLVRLKQNWRDFFRQSVNIEVLVLKNISSYYFKLNTLLDTFYGCINLRLIDGVLDVSKCTKSNSNYFVHCGKLESVKLYKLNCSIGLASCKMLSSESVRYMIENATDATITITLHQEAYDRAIADAGVQTALANKTNVSLAKSE